jgi:hypothetical protein
MAQEVRAGGVVGGVEGGVEGAGRVLAVKESESETVFSDYENGRQNGTNDSNAFRRPEGRKWTAEGVLSVGGGVGWQSGGRGGEARGGEEEVLEV